MKGQALPKYDPRAFTAAVAPIALSNRGYSKIFLIGANNTGKTTLKSCLELYGFQFADQREQAMTTAKQTRLGNYEPLKRLVGRFDAFQDSPFSVGLAYVAADCLFPNSKFILTERDPEDWFASLCRRHEIAFGPDGRPLITEEDIRTRSSYLHPGHMHEALERFLLVIEDGAPRIRWDLLYDREYYLDEYERRNLGIRKYFHGRPGSLLAIDLAQERSTARLCAFLDIPQRFAITLPELGR